MSVKGKWALVVAVFVGAGLRQGATYIHQAMTVADLPTANEMRSMLNDCESFVANGDSARRAVKMISAPSRLDSGGATGARYDWKWVTGAKSSDRSLHAAIATFVFDNASKQWHVDRFDNPSGQVNYVKCSVE